MQELDAFEGMVRKGEEVTPAGLSELISHAAALLFMNEADNSLVGISALKRPRQTYRRKVFKRAHSKLDPEDYCFELGWVFVAKSHRGRRLSRILVKELIPHMGTEKVYATCRKSNKPMRRTLERFGFRREGSPYVADNSYYTLELYVRPSASPKKNPLEKKWIENIREKTNEAADLV